MNYIIVNYHYIRPEKLRGLNPCTEEIFQKQLDYLCANYKMGSAEDVYKAAKSRKPGRFCSLTFDDGLKEHYSFVFPLLKKYSICGTFFLSGEILQERKILLTHKLHLLLLRLDIADLVDMFHKFFKDKYHIDDKTIINPRRRFGDILTINLKETLIALPFSERAAFINYVFDKYYDEKKIIDTLFMNFEEAKMMIRGGMEIGAHGFHHISLEALSREEQRKDIETGRIILEKMLGIKPKIFSYPHGRANSETFEILRDNGFKYGVTIKSEDLGSATDPFLIPRYDTNDIKIL